MILFYCFFAYQHYSKMPRKCERPRSPTMDLLAFVMTDGQLCVHRLNWQKVWAVPVDAAVRRNEHAHVTPFMFGNATAVKSARD